MNYWQFKVPMKDWDNNFGDEFNNLTIGSTYLQSISKNAKHKPKNNIGDIVFIYNTKKNATKMYPQGIYLVCKIIENLDEDYEIELEVIKDFRESPIEPSYIGFKEVMEKINKLSQNGTYYKFEEEDNPQELYNLIINDKTDNLLPEQFNDEEVNKLTEGAKKEITVNAYERSSQARQKCIEKYGTKCSVCDFDFEQKYGKIGKDFIHVHHLTTISSIAENYEVNPIEDLRPVCPNCHAMLHKKQPEPYTINELKEIIKNNIVTTIEIKFSGHSGSFNNAMIMHGEAKFHQENINKLISKCKSIDEVMEILKQYFEEKQPKHCTDITATIDGDIFSIKKDLTSYEQISI